MERRNSGLIVIVALLGCFVARGRCRAADTTRPTDSFGLPIMPPPVGIETDGDVQLLLDRVDDPNAEVRARAAVLLKNCSRRALSLLKQDLSNKNHTAGALVLLKDAETVLTARDKFATRLDDYFPWEKNMLRTAYHRGGNTNPKWDDAVGALFDDWYDVAYNDDATVEHKQAFSKACHKLIAGGCGDPLLAMMAFRTDMDLPGADVKTLHQKLKNLMGKMAKGNLPIRLKFSLTLQFFRLDKPVEGPLLDRCVEWFPAVISADEKDSPPPSRHIAYSLASVFNSVLRQVRAEDVAFGIVDPAYEAAWPNDGGPDALAGHYYVDKAWQARGDGWANTVTDAGEKNFAGDLDIAQDRLEKAYTADSTAPWPCDDMITVSMGKSLPIVTMELWFDRAMAANPDDENACSCKLQYLRPRWGGSNEQMLAFATKCYQTSNWRGRMPFMLNEAHRLISEDWSNDLPRMHAYLEKPDVWADCQTVYLTALDLYPGWLKIRCQYAAFLCDTRRLALADAQFKIIGDDPGPEFFDRNRGSYQFYRDYAAGKKP